MNWVSAVGSSTRLVLLVCLLLSVSFSITRVTPVRASSLQPHAPILIDGNSAFTVENGVTIGSGTLSDPFVIQGLVIAGGSKTPGILISNTNAYFVIRNIFVYSTDYYFNGISLANVTNGAIEDSRIGFYSTNLAVFSSRNILLSGNDVLRIDIDSSQDVTVSGSSSALCPIIVVTSSDNVTLASNRCSVFQIVDSSRVTMENNTFLSIIIRATSPEQIDSLTIAPNNTQHWNGRPVLFYKNCSGLSLYSNKLEFGELIVANCNGVRIANLTSNDSCCILMDLVLVDHAVVENMTSSARILIADSHQVQVSHNHDDIDIESTTGVRVSSNVGRLFISASANVSAQRNRGPVRVVDSPNVTISDNYLEGVCDCGALSVAKSDHVAVSGNNIVGEPGIEVDDSAFIDVSNNRVAGIILNSCSNIAIQRNQAGVGYGASPPYAIGLDSCSGVNILDNNIAGSGPSPNWWFSQQLLKISVSDNVTITGNNLSNSTTAIGVSDSSNILINNNKVQSNAQGVVLNDTMNVRVFHNNFIDNPIQVNDTYSTQNAWDNGYPSGGNYWSDYAAIDNCSGPSQDVCPGPDGIADQSRFIPPTSTGYSIDRYPLLKPWSVLNATLDLDPNPIASRTMGKYLTAYIELPQRFDVSNIDPSTIRLNSSIPRASGTPVTIGDHDNDGQPELMVKFSLKDVKALLPGPGNYILKVTGETIVGGRPFIAFDSVRVV